MAKRWCSEQQGKVLDECLQLFGGYGYMAEYPVARLYADARVQRIYGGTTEPGASLRWHDNLASCSITYTPAWLRIAGVGGIHR